MKKLILLLFGLITNISAQEKSLEKLVTIGISQPILNNVIGFHIGFSPSFLINKIIFFRRSVVSYIIPI